MANHAYLEEKITKNTFETGIKTKVNAKNLFTVLTTLQGVAGDVIVKNTYKFTGNVVDGDTNAVVADADRGKLAYTSKEYRIKAYKFVYDILDKEKRQNGNVIPFSAQGASEVVWNKINKDFHIALATVTKSHVYTTLSWDAVEDALAELNLETREGMFLLANPKDYSTLKKSAEVKAANNGEIIFTGQLKMVDGLAIVTSIDVPVGTLYIASKDTVVNEIKEDATVSIDRYNELEKSTYVTAFAGLTYLADERHAIKMTKQA